MKIIIKDHSSPDHELQCNKKSQYHGCAPGKKSNAYSEIGKKVFAECNRDVKSYFGVNARNNIPKLRYEEAVKYIKGWQPCTNTKMQIRDCNYDINSERK